MGALTRIMSGGKSGDSGSDSSSSNSGGMPAFDAIRKAFGRKKGGRGGSSGTPSGSPSGGSAVAAVSGDGDMPKYHRGGKVRKTGAARLRKGEHVLTGRQYRKMKGRHKGRSKSR